MPRPIPSVNPNPKGWCNDPLPPPLVPLPPPPLSLDVADPDMCDFRMAAKLARLVTLLLSAFKSTGRAASEWERSWERSCGVVLMGGGWGGTPGTRLFNPGDGEGECCWSNPDPGRGKAIETLHDPIGRLGAWYGLVLLGSLRANILRTDCGLAAPTLVNKMCRWCFVLKMKT